MIPYSSDIHTLLAAEITPALRDYFKAEIKFGVVFSSATKESVKLDTVKKIESLISENEIQAEIAIITESDVLQGILKLAEGNDLLIMGGKTGDFIELLISRSLAREITEQVKCPVLWLKEYEEKDSFFKSLFKIHKN